MFVFSKTNNNNNPIDTGRWDWL